MSGLAVGLQTLEDLGRRRDALLSERFIRRVADEQRTLLSDWNTLIAQLSALRAEISASGPVGLAPKIQRLVDQNVRPLSKALWNFENQELPRVAVSSLWRWGQPSPQWRALLVSGLWSITTISSAVLELGLRGAVEYGVIFGLFIGAAHVSIRGHIAHRVFSRASGVIGFAVATSLVAYTVLLVVDEQLVAQAGWLFVVAGAAWHAALIISVFVVDAIRALRRQVAMAETNAVLRPLGTPEHPAGLGDYRNRQLSREVHGRVQGRLLGLAREAQNPTGRVNVAQEIDRVIDELRRLASDTTAEIEAPNTRDQLLDGLIASWAGILEVHFEADARGLFARDDTIPAESLELLREAFTNAFRHANASEVRVGIYRGEDGMWHGWVVDNGYGPRRGERGLGSEIFDALCDTWELQANPEGGSTLVFAFTPDSR